MKKLLPFLLIIGCIHQAGCAARVMILAETSDAVMGKVSLQKEQTKDDVPPLEPLSIFSTP